jgi:hypothetical protein
MVIQMFLNAAVEWTKTDDRAHHATGRPGIEDVFLATLKILFFLSK